MENIIETRYLNIFRFFYSKYSPVSTGLLQRYNSDSNACSSSFYGIASSARVVTVLMVKMSLKKHPVNFNFENRKKSLGAKSGECSG